MSTVTPMSDAELERRIERERELADAAMREAAAESNPRERRRLEDKARGHLQVAFGLESRRTDERVRT